MSFFNYILCALTGVALISCAAAKSDSDSSASSGEPVKAVGFGDKRSGAQVMPKAVIFKLNGDFAKYVFVNVNPASGAIVSFPAPTDLSANSSPVDLGDGWWLDRRGGINPNSRFLDLTYAQYAALSSAPSVEWLKSHFIPDARVTECVTTPVLAADAVADPSLVKKYIPNR